MRLLHDSAYAGLLHLAAWRHFRTPADLDDARACAERLLEDLPREAERRLTPDPTRPDSRRYEPWIMYELPTDVPLPAEYRTPILMRTVELCRLLYEADGGEVFREGAARYLGVLEGIQIRQGAWQGDFLAWPGLDRRQKVFEDSWSGCFTGCVHGHTLGGLTVMAASDDPLAATACDMLTRYLDGFFLPLTRRTPFALPANGIATDGEPRWFAGIRHAMNGTYALLWADVLRAGDVLGRDALLDDAARIALWFAGVHPGVREQASDAWHGMSCHYGRGLYAANCWSRMPNAVSNGFAAGPQFKLLPLGSPHEDAPRHWHDEDWILHGAASVELLTEIEQRLSRQRQP